MTHLLSTSAKEIIIKKALSGEQTIKQIALANNIGFSTLQKWIRRFKTESSLEKQFTHDNKQPVTLAERFKHLQATAGQEDVIVGAYCRKHGLYPHQLTQWEAEFMTKDTSKKQQESASELKALRAENSSLKKIILRKDKALAETVALLVLKKKASQIWGDGEED